MKSLCPDREMTPPPSTENKGLNEFFKEDKNDISLCYGFWSYYMSALLTIYWRVWLHMLESNLHHHQTTI